MRDPSRGTPGAWFERHAAVVVVLAFALVWGSVAALSPDTMRYLQIHPVPMPQEGPFETAEEAVIAACLVAWILLTRRMVGNRLRVALAGGMVLQLALLLGEELDWGRKLGLLAPDALGGHRNLRMYLRDVGLLEKWNDAIVPVLYLLFFLLVPLLPIQGVRRWLDRAVPIRARTGDSLALLLVVLLWLLLGALFGATQSMEFVQMGAYLVVGVFTARIWRAT